MIVSKLGYNEKTAAFLSTRFFLDYFRFLTKRLLILKTLKEIETLAPQSWIKTRPSFFQPLH